MQQELKDRLYNFADSFMSGKSYRNYDDFLTVEELLINIENDFNLPFSFQIVHGEDAFIQPVCWNSKLGHSVIIDRDWYLPFSNTQAFIDALETTWKATERVKNLLEQIKI